MPMTAAFDGPWMLRLCELAKEWVRGERLASDSSPMAAYIDLIFAFGLASLGESHLAQSLAQRAAADLGGRDEVHRFLLAAYGYWIKQALEGKPHGGPLPDELVESLSQMDRMPLYVVDRLRQH